jgi:glutamine synthetase
MTAGPPPTPSLTPSPTPTPTSTQAMRAAFVDYYVHIKNADIERFQVEVSDWEYREYFAMF